MQENLVVPNHIGFIMDGNGRWAQAKGKPRNYGHGKGADKIEEVVEWSFNAGIKCVSLYAFSQENLGRPKEEVEKIFSLLEKFLKKFSKSLIKNEIRLVVSGELDVLDKEVLKSLHEVEQKTSCFLDRTLNIAFNYGGRQDIVSAVNRLIQKEEAITEESLSNELANRGIGDMDLVVRTSGEQRISNFYLWQISYAEIYFSKLLWPDFSKEEFDNILNWFSNRKRRFGKL